MRRYTFRMELLFWVLLIAGGVGAGVWFRTWRRRQAEREQAAEQRLAAFVTQSKPAAPVADPAQKLLFDAAAKAGDANEPVLSIQLYARLLSRFPGSAFAEQARAAVEAQKKKVAKP